MLLCAFRSLVFFLLKLSLYIPFLSFLLFWHYLYLVSEATGHTPYYGHPDPKDVYAGYHNFHIVLFLVNFYSLIAVLFLVWFRTCRELFFRKALTVWLFIGGVVCYFCLFFHMLEWFVD